MTPRESLEAAGWYRDHGYWFHPSTYPVGFKEAEALADLARDEAKETSDGDDGSNSAHLDGDDRTSPLDTVVPDKAAPVATSVSAPDDLGPRLLATHNWMQAHEVVWEGYFFRVDGRRNCSLSFLLAEYASSSSAAPERKLWIESINAELAQLREWANTEAKRAEAAEAKVAELRKELDHFAKQNLEWANCAEQWRLRVEASGMEQNLTDASFPAQVGGPLVVDLGFAIDLLSAPQGSMVANRIAHWQKRAEAAEVKCAELQREAVQQGRILSELRDELWQTKKLKDTALETHDELRDSRDRLQAELSKPCCGERHRMNHELKVEAPPSSRGGG